MLKCSNDIQILTSIHNISLCEDGRRLIPFVKDNKWGLVNRNGEIVLEAKYDAIFGECRNADDLLLIGIICVKYYTTSGNVTPYLRMRYGLVDSKGNILLAPVFNSLLISDDNKLVSVSKEGTGCAVLDLEGREVVPYGHYSFIDGFDHGYARVKSLYNPEDPTNTCLFGIIDVTGEEILPCKYTNIWNFYGKNRNSTRVENSKTNESFQFSIQNNFDGNKCMDKIESYPSHYGEYEGSYAQDIMGYSDETIDDAFEGDPDAYWNID